MSRIPFSCGTKPD